MTSEILEEEVYLESSDFKNKITMQETALNLQDFTKKIQDHFENYETRESQKSMIRTIVKGMSMGEHSLIEAPTGTGKSLGYLLSFLSIWNQFEYKRDSDDNLIERKPKLCIATNTIALQEQLMSKDIPMLQEILGLKFKAALIKGRNNYICPKELNLLLDEETASFSSVEESLEFDKLRKEIMKDSNLDLEKGDRSNISFAVSNKLWEKVSTDSKNCLGQRCELYGECPFFRAKIENAKADVLVTNHAMFFADLKVQIDTEFEYENLVLPNYDYLTFDEAHNLEEVASDFFGNKSTLRSIKNLFGSFKKQSEGEGDLSEYFSKLPEFKNEIEKEFNLLITLGEDLYTHIHRSVTNGNITQDTTTRIFEPVGDWLLFANNYFRQTHVLRRSLRDALNAEIDERSSVVEKRFDALQKGLTDHTENLKVFLQQTEEEDTVYWIETSKQKYESQSESDLISLNRAPINVNNTLREHLFNRQESVVLTSATLGTNNLDYIAKRLGLDRYIGKMFFSPFDYEKQSALYIPAQTVNPKAQDYSQYAEFEMRKIIKEAKGRTLVLFTSYKMLNEAYTNLKPFIETELGYNLLKQGELPRTPLINKFREDVHSVLFATSSYWEGIDVQGESLSSVIIVKLPFDVPDQPVIQARMEDINRKGGNAFMDYQVPIAIMKFKQGFGRLIRSTKDSGVVSVLDERIIKMRYGQQFLNSLPKINIYRNIEDTRDFFK